MSEHIPLLSAVLASALWGLFGALVRVGISALRYKQLGQTIALYGLALYALIVLFTGAFVGIIFNFGKAGSFIGGYAGLDIIDGLHKAFKAKKIEVQK